MKRQFTEKEMQVAPKHMKRNSSELIIKEMQIKITPKDHLNGNDPKVFTTCLLVRLWGKKALSLPLVGMQNCVAPTEGTSAILNKTANLFIL